MRNIVLATVYMLAFLGILWGFFTEDSRFAWLAALATLSIVGIIFHRWFSPRGRPRKTVRERTQDGRTLLFDKNEELKRVGFFDRIQGEFAVFFFVTALYMEDALAGHMSVLLFAVMTGVIWFINRPPHPLRHAPDRIYGTKDALLVAQGGVTEQIPYSRIARHEVVSWDGLVWYGYVITLRLPRPGKLGGDIRFFMTTPTRALEEGLEGGFVEPVPFEEDLFECLHLHNGQAMPLR